MRKFDAGGVDHFKPWDYGFERMHLAAFSAVMVDQKREAMALHAYYGHQNFDDLKETLAAEGIEIDKDCRRWVSACPLCQLKNAITSRIHKRSEQLSADWRPIKGTVWIVDIWFFKDLFAKAETGGFGMMVVLYKPGAGFSLAHPVKEKDEASLIDCAHYFARWLGHPHLVYMDGEKAGAGVSFQSWLWGDGSPGLHPIEYRQGPPYVGKGLQALVEHCIRSNRKGVALLILDLNHRFPLAVIHLVAMEERWRSTRNICRRSRTTSASGGGLVLIKKEPSSWLRRAENRKILDYGKLLQGKRGEQAPTTADRQGETTSVTGAWILSSPSEHISGGTIRGVAARDTVAGEEIFFLAG
uniref:Uncharacterized protein n=1 Tax=Chromera velia CCMP2878 TaxID=1169474 RepID=A0A0G4EYQ2_9ALVE|eukprot:Cvel_14191.t1-p1 / transcript=Cvel_14191.t1 / gene=Cvel_14191 / organism=Chromera_velia_CCMP2878 / gene_product=hypothetical protein / transcript_product=hypothetical protein / location=Cvel_scaffold1000:37845-39144(+) / protein_length=355 / sequence_SO=supercontig / SO=protein_coding / is_pseudo=false